MKRKTLALVLLIPLSAPYAVAWDEGFDEGVYHPWLSDKFLLHVGGFLPRKSIELAARGSIDGDLIPIDFDKTFQGGDKENVAAISFHWRFGQKWWLSTEHYRTRFSESAQLEKEIEWNGVIFPVGAYAKAGVSNNIYRLVVGREVFRNHNSDLGLSVGVHWMDLGAFIEGEIRIGDGVTGVQRESVSASAPLPNVGLTYQYSLSRKWLVGAQLDWFSASFDEYSGSIKNYNVGINYQINDHFGLGLSYKRFQVDVDVDKSGWYGAVKLAHKGPFISVTSNW